MSYHLSLGVSAIASHVPLPECLLEVLTEPCVPCLVPLRALYVLELLNLP